MKEIPFSRIKIGENYSRESIGDVSTLVESIREHGLQQPLIVDSNDNLVAGFRRYEALTKLGWQGPIWVSVTDSPNPPVINLIENLERKNLSFYEEALAVKRLFPGYSEQEVADAVGLTRGWSRPRIKMWELPQEIIDKIRLGDLTAKKVAQIVNSKNSKALCDKLIGGEELPDVVGRPGKKEIQSAITTCLERGQLDLAQAFRYVLGDINEEEFWDSVGRDL
jgi:ParB family chromosome partitioning protein